MKKNVEDLKCGDVFTFRDVAYLCLMSFTDNRHSQTIVTAVRPPGQNPPWTKLTPNTVYALRLFRTFKALVIEEPQPPGASDLHLVVFENSPEELAEIARVGELPSLSK